MMDLSAIKFSIGQFVYLVTDPEQMPRLVTEIHLKATGAVYILTCIDKDSSHYEFEISETKNEAHRIGFNHSR